MDIRNNNYEDDLEGEESEEEYPISIISISTEILDVETEEVEEALDALELALGEEEKNNGTKEEESKYESEMKRPHLEKENDALLQELIPDKRFVFINKKG